jgi:NADH-quinone oxidoreductase subunit M
VMGVDGGVFQILNESLIGAAFFLLLGLLYERYGTYEMRDYGGLATKHPWMVTMFVIVTLAAVGLPMLNGFVGEFLILAGTMQSTIAHHIAWTVVGTTGVIFGAGYMLWMIQRVFYGALGLRPTEVKGWDLTAREHIALWPFAALFLIMGVASPIWMQAIDTYGTATAGVTQTFEPTTIKHSESETYSNVDNPCSRILADRALDANYDKMHHRGICNADGTLVDPAWYYSTQASTKEAN